MWHPFCGSDGECGFGLKGMLNFSHASGLQLEKQFVWPLIGVSPEVSSLAASAAFAKIFFQMGGRLNVGQLDLPERGR